MALRTLAGITLVLAGCAPTQQTLQFKGQTMGTTYQVTYVGKNMELAPAAEALLAEINQSMSTYIPSSTISQINSSVDPAAWYPVDRHFEIVFRRSREIYEATEGAFNPAVGPLVNAWGFGPENPETLPNKETVRELLKLVNFDNFEFRDSPAAIRKHSADAKLDFSAIAKGYGVDAIAGLLEQHDIRNYLVEIGGEVRARGERERGRGWRIGVEQPAAAATADRKVLKVFELRDKGLATSGTYRNYEIVDGRKIAHILDPKTGYPAQNSLLSVSIAASEAMTADAYATAFMVMGVEKGMKFLETHRDLDAFFITDGGDGRLNESASPGFPRVVDE